MKKVALLGLGRWGKNHLRELVNLGSSVVVLLHTPNVETEAWLRENYPQVTYTYEKDAITNDPSLSEVVIATPMGTHFELAKEFILAGKKVFVEKPVTDSAADASALVTLAEKKQVQFMVGHIFLYHDCFLKIREEISQRKIISVLAIKTSRSIENPTVSKQVFLDSFIHEVSILLKLFGAPEKVSYEESRNTLMMDFSGFSASVTIKKPEGDEKVRQFEFNTNENGYLWLNDELFEKGTKTLLSKPSQSALMKELDIFLNHYEEWEAEIQANNKIAAESVKILETLLLSPNTSTR